MSKKKVLLLTTTALFGAAFIHGVAGEISKASAIEAMASIATGVSTVSPGPPVVATACFAAEGTSPACLNGWHGGGSSGGKLMSEDEMKRIAPGTLAWECTSNETSMKGIANAALGTLEGGIFVYYDPCPPPTEIVKLADSHKKWIHIDPKVKNPTGVENPCGTRTKYVPTEPGTPCTFGDPKK
ncbi:MAG: hypothetical protein LBG65_07850 [Puniceicoccales bacterium]|jgi:hypothetical protein|nr:hypothetical protein [Puniceicoccales bacterium]